jgi:ankyrin repeat protein
MNDIFAAARMGDADQVVALLTNEPHLADANNDQQRTALHYAAREGHADTVRALLQAGADPNCVRYPNKEITLPRTLAWHARYGHEQVVDYLLLRGAATDLPDDEPWATPLAWARKKGHDDIVKLLREHGAAS